MASVEKQIFELASLLGEFMSLKLKLHEICSEFNFEDHFFFEDEVIEDIKTEMESVEKDIKDHYTGLQLTKSTWPPAKILKLKESVSSTKKKLDSLKVYFKEKFLMTLGLERI